MAITDIEKTREGVQKSIESGEKNVPQVGSELLKKGFKKEEVDRILEPWSKPSRGNTYWIMYAGLLISIFIGALSVTPLIPSIIAFVLVWIFLGKNPRYYDKKAMDRQKLIVALLLVISLAIILSISSLLYLAS